MRFFVTTTSILHAIRMPSVVMLRPTVQFALAAKSVTMLVMNTANFMFHWSYSLSRSNVYVKHLGKGLSNSFLPLSNERQP